MPFTETWRLQSSSFADVSFMTSTPVKQPPSKQIRSHSCEKCVYKSKFKHNVKQHIESKHSDEIPHKYKSCGRCFSSENDLKCHREKLHQDTHYCEMCGRNFITKADLKYHTKHQHLNKVGKHSCNVCGKKFEEVGHFCGHAAAHTGILPYKCAICQKEFAYKSNFQGHVKCCSNGTSTATCDICHVKLSSLDALKEHTCGKHTQTFVYVHVCRSCKWRSSIHIHKKKCEALFRHLER